MDGPALCGPVLFPGTQMQELSFLLRILPQLKGVRDMAKDLAVELADRPGTLAALGEALGKAGGTSTVSAASPPEGRRSCTSCSRSLPGGGRTVPLHARSSRGP